MYIKVVVFHGNDLTPLQRFVLSKGTRCLPFSLFARDAHSALAMMNLRDKKTTAALKVGRAIWSGGAGHPSNAKAL